MLLAFVDQRHQAGIHRGREAVPRLEEARHPRRCGRRGHQSIARARRRRGLSIFDRERNLSRRQIDSGAVPAHGVACLLPHVERKRAGRWRNDGGQSAEARLDIGGPRDLVDHATGQSRPLDEHARRVTADIDRSWRNHVLNTGSCNASSASADGNVLSVSTSLL